MSNLTFNSVSFNVVNQNNQTYLTSAEISKALGYARSDKVTQLYERNKAEFTPSMSETLNLRLSGNLQTETRIFSLRGAHLLAMFARTTKAAEFRHWVLDVLEKQTSPALLADPMEVLRSGRWLMTFQNGNVVLNPVPHDALVLAPEEIPFFIGKTTNVPKTLLPSIISACAKRLDTLV